MTLISLLTVWVQAVFLIPLDRDLQYRILFVGCVTFVGVVVQRIYIKWSIDDAKDWLTSPTPTVYGVGFQPHHLRYGWPWASQSTIGVWQNYKDLLHRGG